MSRSKQHGFTLMEILIAMVLLSIAIIALQKGIVLAQNARISADELRTAESLYRRQMHELSTNQASRSQHNGSFSALLTKGASKDDIGSQEFLKDIPDWRWRATYTKTDMPEVLRITLTIHRSKGSVNNDILMEERMIWLP